MSASGESSTTIHRLLHASGSHPIPPPNDPMAFRQLPCWRLGAWLRPVSRGNRHFMVGGGRLRLGSDQFREEVVRNKFRREAAAAAQGGGDGDLREEGGVCF
ncbi:hypothetical protein F511_42832 [Dorcoceras hygrometricum]|uniref:Uncharacterized protein n=1 Tax=Dorcoceras hygrometricum TaxID=472368 RepID=A0A2Z7A7F1_9LAMI|nr:hypothetical protein F511_42832 [Dorcoceras hygrometricum]